MLTSIIRQSTRQGLIGLTLTAASLTAVAHETDHPDFSGVWEAYASEPAGGRGAGSTLTEEGQAMVDEFMASFGDSYVEPGAFCVPPGLPATMTSMVSYPVEVIHSEDRVTMLAEYDMQVRRVYMDGRDFPDDYPTTRMGYSIGHWEDDTLVIDTRILGEYLLSAWPRTEETRVVERVYRTTREEAGKEASGFVQASDFDDVLVFEMTITDPKLYDGPQEVTMYYQRIPDDSFLEYDCPADLWRRALEGEISYE